MEQNSLIKSILERYKKYQEVGLNKEQILKMLNKTEFALIAFYFLDKEEEEKKRLSTSNIELAEIIYE